ncbi:MAG TPA: hypothetical protein ENK77_03210 [Epsilonproteobacteria bacterium]|nr:hypothetical protein [Campylobacterota bacterium]
MRRLREKLNTIFAVWLSAYLVVLQLATTSPELHHFIDGASFQQSMEHSRQDTVADGGHDHHQCAVTLLALGILPTLFISYHFETQQTTKPVPAQHDLYIVVASAKDFNPRDPPQNSLSH